MALSGAFLKAHEEAVVEALEQIASGPSSSLGLGQGAGEENWLHAGLCDALTRGQGHCYVVTEAGVVKSPHFTSRKPGPTVLSTELGLKTSCPPSGEGLLYQPTSGPFTEPWGVPVT